MGDRGRGVAVIAAAVAVFLLVAQLTGLLSGTTAGYIVVGLLAPFTVLPLVRTRPRRTRGEPRSPQTLPEWLDVSDDVIEYIQRRGNVLYVWGKDVGSGFAVLESALEPPPGVKFEDVLEQPFRLRLEAGVVRPPELRIRYRSWPSERLIADRGRWGGDGGLSDFSS